MYFRDNALHFSRGAQTLDEVMELLRNVSDVISANFPTIPVIPSLGNHDFVPKDEARTNYSEPYGRIADIWKTWIGDDRQMELFKKGGYFSRRVGESGKLLVLSVNTILYYIHNHINLGLTDPAGQFTWMEKQLEMARREGLKVIVTGHVMPGLRIPGLEHLFHPDFSRRYADIMTDFSDVIVASHYGHEHAEVFKLLRRENSPLDAAVPVFSAMSIAPMARALKPGQPKYPLQPSVRLVEFDRATAHHLNYRQFYTNLTQSNLNNYTNWVELYNFRDTYGVPDMSVASLRDIFRRMVSAQSLTINNNTINNNNSTSTCCSSNDAGHTLSPASPVLATGQVVNPLSSFCRHILGPMGPAECPLVDQAEIWCGGQISDLSGARQCVQFYLLAHSGQATTPSGKQN
ncbi:acid sphingomyelinase-like phosphodiesterase 3b [Elysia marginata]|uniref:Acid sphingomyelinase-like phosphodiesterase 3b n=1 Tax=Elysia marginata TaxID=1093978 RepID=A0AAV4GB36_9GAST|nr:acid sphingomyelinase-like phosphodiesterase 3b [Elysia marginata]